MIIFQSEKEHILNALNRISVFVNTKTKSAKSIICEVVINENKASFSIHGSSYSIACKSDGNVRFSINFLYFFELIKQYKASKIVFKINNDTILLDEMSFKVNFCVMEVHSSIRKIELPINYTDANLLSINKMGYTKLEIDFYNLQQEIDKAEEKLKNNILKAYELLKTFNITQKDLEQLVNSKIK